MPTFYKGFQLYPITNRIRLNVCSILEDKKTGCLKLFNLG